MKGFLSELFQNSLYSEVLLFLWGILAVIFGARGNLFSLPVSFDRKKIPITFISVCAIFSLFVFSTYFLGPLFIYFFQKISILKSFPLESISPFMSVLQVFITFSLLLWFSFRYQKEFFLFLISPPHLEKPSITKNVVISFFSWWIIFPSVMFIYQVVASLTLYLFHLTELPNQMAIEFLKLSLSSPIAFFFALIVIIVLAPITEELLFRGYLHNWLKKFLGRNAALIFSSLAFSLFHFSFGQGLSNIPILSSIFILGLFLGFIYERQNSLSAPILLHSLFNLTSALNFAYLQGPS